MRVTTVGPNLRDQSTGTFHVHAEGCRDLKRAIYRFAESDTRDFPTRRALVLDAYPPEDFQWDPATEYGMYRDDFHFFPCVDALPEGDPQEEEETLCRYCGEPVAEEYDAETGRVYRPAYHFGCYHCQVPVSASRPAPLLTSLYNGEVKFTRAFVYLLRALEEAAHLARCNRAEWSFVVTDETGSHVDTRTGLLPVRP